MSQLLAHPVVLDGQEDCVEDDAEGDDNLEESVVDDGEEDILGLKPTVVVKATGPAAGAVSVVAGFCKVCVSLSSSSPGHCYL